MTLTQLEAYFSKPLPGQIQLTPWERVTDVRACVDAHIRVLKSNPGKKLFLPYWNRLVSLSKII